MCASFADAGTSEIYRRALNGDVDAMRQMGKMALNGIGGVKQSRANAIRWFEKAAEEGDATSMIYLGDLHVDSNPQKALEWYKNAYEAGKKVAKKRVMAMPFSNVKSTIEEWAMEGDEECLAYLLEGYTQGKHGIRKDFDKAKRFFSEAEDEYPALADKILNKLSDKEKAELSDTFRRKQAKQAREEEERERERAREQAEKEREAAREREAAEREVARKREEAEREAAREAERKERERQERICNAFANGDINQFNTLVAEGGTVSNDDIKKWLEEAVTGTLLPAHLELAKAQGIDVNFRSGYNDKTLLIIAVDKGREKSVKLLLDAGFNPNLADNLNKTALDYAIEKNAASIAALLIKAGSKVKEERTLNRALEIALETGKTKCLKLILEAGADSNTILHNGNPALVEAVNAESQPQHRLAVMSLLLQHGANPNTTNPNGSTTSVLMAAAMADKCEEAKLLIHHGADVNYVDSAFGMTPLHAAVIGANVAIVKELLEAKVNINAQTTADFAQIKSGSTPLHLAVLLKDEGQRRSVAHALIEAGADVSICNIAGETPQMLAMAANDQVLNQELENIIAEQEMMDNIVLYGSIAGGVLLLLLITKVLTGKKAAPVVVPQNNPAPKFVKKSAQSPTAKPQLPVEDGFFIMAPDGTQDGPFNTIELRERVNSGVYSPDSLAWREGMSEWLPVVELLARFNI